jgi:hypothetical protein
VTYKTPESDALPTGASIDGNTILINGSNVDFAGWDFTGSGGWGIYIYSGSTYSFTNCKWAPTSTNFSGAPMVNDAGGTGSFTNCLFDLSGNEVDPGLALTGAGTVTIEYCYFNNSYGHFIQSSNLSATDLSLIVQFNLFQNWGRGLGLGPHPQPLQVIGYGSVSNVFEFNTLYLSNSAYGGLGVSWGDNVETPTLTNLSGSYNTIMLPAGQVTGFWVVNLSQISGPAGITYNYVDPAAITGVYFQFGGSGSITTSNNLNMRTGATI